MPGITLVIHHIPGRHKRIISEVNKLRGKGEGQVSVLAFRDKSALEKGGVPCKAHTDYLSQDELDQILIGGIEFYESLATKEIDKQKALLELVEYDNSSLWWLAAETWVYAPIRETIYRLEILRKILDKVNPDGVLIIDDKTELVKVLALVARYRGVPVIRLRPGAVLWLKSLARSFAPRRRVLNMMAGLKDGIRARILSASPPLRPMKANGQRTILLSSAGRQHVLADPNTGKKKREDVVLQPIISRLEADKASRLLFLDSTLGLGEAIRATKTNNLPLVLRRPESYLNPEIRKVVGRQKKNLVGKWKSLEDSRSLENPLTYKEMGLSNLLHDSFKYVFCQKFVEVVEKIELAKNILQREKPDILVLASETSIFNRALILACKNRNIPSLAVHHGNIIPLKTVLNVWWFSDKHQKGNLTKLSVMPDRVCVYGEEHRDRLIQSGFPRERIVVTGQPRFDILARAKELYDRQSFCQRWGIDPSKKIALIGSQPFDHIEGDRAGYRHIFIENIMKSLKDEPEIQVVIKPHPYEGDQWHKAALERLGISAIILPAQSNPYEALYACDVLITFYSTIFMEALILGKPVVTVNLTGRPSPVPIAEKGIALGAYTAQDIAPAVLEALWNSETKNSLKVRADTYLQSQVYKTDGQATDRVVRLIYNMMDKNPREASADLQRDVV